METKQFICSVFTLPKKCYPRFNIFQKQFLSLGQRFQVTLEKFHKLINTEETEDLQQIGKIVKNLADAKEVQVAIFGKFHDKISSRNLVTAKDSKYLPKDCVPSRIRRNEWMTKFVQCGDAEGKPVVYVYLVHVDKNDNLQEKALNILKDEELLDLPSTQNLFFLVWLDPSIEREDSSIKTFEKSLRNIFHDTDKVDVHEGGPDEDFQVIFMSSSFEDFISSEGKLPMLIQLHLEWQVIQPMLSIKELIEANFRTYRKSSEEALQGPDAVYESLKERLLETFLNNRRCILLMLLDKLFFKEGLVDFDKMTQVLLEVLAQVLQCLMVEILAKIYGIKEYRLNQMFEEIVFKKECSITIKHSIRDSLLKSFPSGFFNYECKKLQEEEGRKYFCELFSKTCHKSFLKELEKIADTDLKILANRVHEELEKREWATEKNLAIQYKLMFETESILKQTDAANYRSHQVPSRNGLSAQLKGDLLRTEGIAGVTMLFGKLNIHVMDCTVEQTKVVSDKIKKTIVKHKYGYSYKIGFITKKPEYYHSVGVGLFSPRIKRHGTLGGFMTDFDNNLYCLTCEHVIPYSSVDVYIENDGQQNEQIMIGQSIRVEIPNTDVPHLSVDAADIVAVKVKPDQIPNCIPFFKTDDNSYGPSQMLPALDCSLGEHHRVYKWGAKTNLTYGFLHTGYYNGSFFEDGVLDKYTYILVEPLPVDDEPLLIGDDNASSKYFAKQGDSGAIICAEREDSRIQTIGMVQGGDMAVRDTLSSIKYSIGFYLSCALDKLMVRSKLPLCAVKFDEEKLQQCHQNRLHIENNYYPH